jgi:hypothetical protein
MEGEMLTRVHACESARDYYQQIRRLLQCAHGGAVAILDGHVATSGSSAASGASDKLAAELVPGIILKAMTKAAESIPFIGMGASALTALISVADERSLRMQMERVVGLAHTPAELTAVIDCLARKLTVLQWPLVSTAATLHARTTAVTFRERVVQRMGAAAADAMYFVEGRRKLNNAEKQALDDVENLLALVADGSLQLNCPPEEAADASRRGEYLALLCVRRVLPGREVMPPLAVAADESESPCTLINASEDSRSSDVATDHLSPELQIEEDAPPRRWWMCGS